MKFPYLVVKRWTSQSFGSTNTNVCACLKLNCVLVYISLKTLDMRVKIREIRDYSCALIAISKNNCFCPRIGFWFWSEQSWMYITCSFLHKWLKRSRKLKIPLRTCHIKPWLACYFQPYVFNYSQILYLFTQMQLQHTKNFCFNLVNQTSFLLIWKALPSFVIFKEGGCISLKFASVFLLLTSFIPACKSYKA